MAEQIATGEPVYDPNSALGHRMRGQARLGGYFDVPLINMVQRVEGGGELWQGGCINGLCLPETFDFVLSLYPWEKYVLAPNTERTEVRMYDSLEQGFEQVDELADEVVRRLRDGQKVLVHCQAGLNRSGLLGATVLKKLGMSGDDAVDLMRHTRGTDQVLCNSAFEAHVREA